MIVGCSGQGMVLPQENRIPGGHVALLRGTAVAHRTASAAEIRAAVGTTTNRQLRARRPIACIPLTPCYCRLRRQRCQARDLLGFLMKAVSGRALVKRRPSTKLSAA
ncbi:transposable element Tcb2 transposase [Trichonephila clavipes]|uniref:Transposable element Tcb2 transposase n=1 Tax=Trichonephila clavipes TaxID=2585209 RepID=A0A8X6V9P5_TRICX|nr:transposable element Tcb2 transposase [Trichonephila clavipes]